MATATAKAGTAMPITFYNCNCNCNWPARAWHDTPLIYKRNRSCPSSFLPFFPHNRNSYIHSFIQCAAPCFVISRSLLHARPPSILVVVVVCSSKLMTDGEWRWIIAVDDWFIGNQPAPINSSILLPTSIYPLIILKGCHSLLNVFSFSLFCWWRNRFAIFLLWWWWWWWWRCFYSQINLNNLTD